MIQYILTLILAVICFIAGLLVSEANPQLKEKAHKEIDYLTGQKKKIKVFKTRELEIDQQRQREEQPQGQQING